VAVTMARTAGRPLGMTYTALAATCWSLAGILQRQLHMSLATQVSGRAVFAVLAVLGFVAIAERGQVLRSFRAIGRPGLVIAVLIAIASVTFITALNDAPVADVVVVQALSPLVAALLGILGGERVRPRTWVAMAIAVAGFAVMAGSPGRPGLAGMSFSLISMVAFAATVVIARHNAHVSMAPATCLSQALVFVVFAPLAHPGEIRLGGLGYLMLLGAVQMGLGLFFFSLGARLISAAEVAIIAQLENVLGPLWVWLAGIEHPSRGTIAGGVIVIAAVAYQVTGSARPGRLAPRPDEVAVTARPGS
jgi:drug/metabolite transporter (DMT)-like permease